MEQLLVGEAFKTTVLNGTLKSMGHHAIRYVQTYTTGICIGKLQWDGTLAVLCHSMGQHAIQYGETYTICIGKLQWDGALAVLCHSMRYV